MGIIEKQSKFNIFILGFAVLFGALNNLLLFPLVLSKEEWGVIRFLPSLTVILTNFALIGSPQILLRYMPKYAKEHKQNNGFFLFILKLSLVGMTLMSCLLLLFKTQLLGLYDENASRLSNYFYYLFPLLVFNSLADLFSAYARAYLESVYQLFIKEIFHRIIQSLLLIFLYFEIIGFELFLFLFVLSQLINIVLLVFYLWKKGILDLTYKKIDFIEQVKMVKYGAANFLSGLGGALTNRVDSLMVTAMVSVGAVVSSNGGLEAVAIYTFGAYLVSIIEMPARAVGNIANSVIAKAWENQNHQELNDVYKKSSVNQLIIGSLFFILIWSGIDELFALLGKYEEAKWVVLFLGMGKILNISVGVMSPIIVSSKHYLFSTYSMFSLALITYLLNLYFIKLYGLNGAALATFLALFIFNLTSVLFLKYKTGLQPFTLRTIYLFVISIFVFFLAHFMNFGLSPIPEVLITSIITSSVFLFLIYFTRVSIEMNNTIKRILFKTGKQIARRLLFPIFIRLIGGRIVNKAGKGAVLNVMYHGVVNSKDKRMIRNIDAKLFSKHLKYFKKNFDVVSLEEAKAIIRNNGMDRKRQAITLSFDDGYLNNFTVLLPILEKYSVPATIYVLGHLADDKNSTIKTVWANYVDVLFQSNETEELHRILDLNIEKQSIDYYYNHIKAFSSDEMKEVLIKFSSSDITSEKMEAYSEDSILLMNSEQIKSISNSPLITIGSHAYWHCNLENQTIEVQEKEMKESKLKLEELIGKSVNSIAFPDGSYTRESIRLAKEIGYNDIWAVKYKNEEDKNDDRILDRFGMPTQTTFESNVLFVNLAFNKHSH